MGRTLAADQVTAAGDTTTPLATVLPTLGWSPAASAAAVPTPLPAPASDAFDAKSLPHVPSAADGAVGTLPHAPGSVLYTAKSSSFPAQWEPKKSRVFIMCLARFEGEKEGQSSFSMNDRTDVAMRNMFEAV